MKHRNLLALGMAGIALGLCGRGVQASGIQLREESAEGMGNAYAGSTAKAYNLDTLFYNPAGMTRLDGNQAGVAVAWIAPVANFSGGNTVAGTATTGTDRRVNPLKATPVGAGYAMWDAAPDLKLGVGITMPFGMHSEYPSNWVGRYQALASDLTVVNVAPSVAYRVTDALSVGGGLQVQWAKAKLTNAINFNALVPGTPDGLARLDGDDVGVGWTASALYEIDRRTRLGLSFRSSIRHTVRGQARFQGVPAALAGSVNFADSRIRSTVTLPDVVSVGAYHEITPKWAVMAEVSWTHWSQFSELRVRFVDSGRPDAVTEQKWKDTLFHAVGLDYKPVDSLTLHLGTAYDQAPVSDPYRNPRFPDSDRIWLSGGISYAIAPDWSVNASYAHLFAGSASIDRADPDAIGGRLTGNYENHVDLVSAGMSVRF